MLGPLHVQSVLQFSTELVQATCGAAAGAEAGAEAGGMQCQRRQERGPRAAPGHRGSEASHAGGVLAVPSLPSSILCSHSIAPEGSSSSGSSAVTVCSKSLQVRKRGSAGAPGSVASRWPPGRSATPALPASPLRTLHSAGSSSSLCQSGPTASRSGSQGTPISGAKLQGIGLWQQRRPYRPSRKQSIARLRLRSCSPFSTPPAERPLEVLSAAVRPRLYL